MPTDFYGMNISGVQRLSNGNTLVCNGPSGDFFEINANDEIVWEYISPVGMGGSIISQGSTPGQNAVFRCTQYSPDYEGFDGTTLTSGAPIEINPLPSECDIFTSIEHNTWCDGNTLRLFLKSKNELVIFSNSSLAKMNIVLLESTGRIIQASKDVDFVANESAILHLPNVLASGIYLLYVGDLKHQSIVKFIHP